MRYRLVTGQLPFPGESAFEVLTALAFEPPPPVRVAAPAVPEALAALIDRLLAKDPGDRPQSATEVAKTLSAVEALLAASTDFDAARRAMVDAPHDAHAMQEATS